MGFNSGYINPISYEILLNIRFGIIPKEIELFMYNMLFKIFSHHYLKSYKNINNTILSENINSI